jgi:hypothetical protein
MIETSKKNKNKNQPGKGKFTGHSPQTYLSRAPRRPKHKPGVDITV